MESISTNSHIVHEIKDIFEQARSNVAFNANSELLHAYWQIGKLIADHVIENDINDLTSRKYILDLSKTLTKELGRGFSRSNLFNMRNFYLNYPDVQTLSGHLSWSHFCELLAISDLDARNFYEKECQNSRWSIREHNHQVDSGICCGLYPLPVHFSRSEK